jgi:hypothetical protein
MTGFAYENDCGEDPYLNSCTFLFWSTTFVSKPKVYYKVDRVRLARLYVLAKTKII